MDRGDAHAVLACAALRGVDLREPRLELAERAARGAREVLEHLVGAQALLHARGAAVRGQRVLERNLAAKDADRLRRTRLLVRAAVRLQERVSERLELLARAAVEACHHMEVVVERKVAEREAVALRVAQQEIHALARKPAERAVEDARGVLREVFLKRHAQRARGARVREQECKRRIVGERCVLVHRERDLRRKHAPFACEKLRPRAPEHHDVARGCSLREQFAELRDERVERARFVARLRDDDEPRVLLGVRRHDALRHA